MMPNSRELSIAIGAGWPVVLERLGIAPEYLVNRHGPCPACGGTDRYRFDNRGGTGGFFCNGCGAGSGFDLLMRVHGWSFRTALARVREAAGCRPGFVSAPMPASRPTAAAGPEVASETVRVRRLRRETCDVADCQDAIKYLTSRYLWPQPQRSDLRAHPSVEYWDAGHRIGRFPALVATVRDFDGIVVTAHVTYLQGGCKLVEREPRKLLSPLTGRRGCAVRLTPIEGDLLGIGEGIETALAAQVLHGVPTWAALNTSLLARFETPPGVRRLVIFADRDIAGLEAASDLMQRLQGRVDLEVRTPIAPAKDWADVLAARQGEVA